MKRLSLALLMGLTFTFAFVACGKKDDKKAEEGAPSITCLQQNCDNSIYANNSEKGFSTFNDSTWSGQPYLLAMQANYYNSYQYNSANFQSGQFCGCGVGYTPVYNSLAGFGCVQSRLIRPVAPGMVYWTIVPNQQVFSEANMAIAASYVEQSAALGLGTASTYTFNTNRCTNFVAEACIVNQPEACRDGRTCQATVNGSPLGVCLK